MRIGDMDMGMASNAMSGILGDREMNSKITTCVSYQRRRSGSIGGDTGQVDVVVQSLGQQEPPPKFGMPVR